MNTGQIEVFQGEKDSTYEIRDFEDDRVSFLCERFEMGE